MNTEGRHGLSFLALYHKGHNCDPLRGQLHLRRSCTVRSLLRSESHIKIFHFERCWGDHRSCWSYC